MNKLFKLREWLTISEAAKHLSVSFGEEVTEADVLRLALDGCIKLSINLVNRTVVQHYPRDNICFSYRNGVYKRQIGGTPDISVMLKSFEKAAEVLSAREHNPIFSIAGLWDLSMIGAECFDVKNAYQNLTGGPKKHHVGIDGTFVEGEDGDLCQLQTTLEENPSCSGSLADLENIKEKIALKNLDEIQAKELLDKHADARKLYLSYKKSKLIDQGHYPAGGLPKSAVWVVKTKVLRKFEEQISGEAEIAKPLGSTERNTSQDEKPLATKERNTLLTIIAALCDYSAINPNDRGVAVKIAKMTDEIGATVGDETIRKVLEKINDAVESRTK